MSDRQRIESVGVPLTQLILSVTVLSMAFAVKVPWMIVAGLATLLMSGTFVVFTRRGAKACLLMSLASMTFIAAGLVFESRSWFVFEIYYLVIAWMMTGTLFLAAHRSPGMEIRAKWRLMAVGFGLTTNLLWLATSYELDRFHDFHAALAGIVSLLICVQIFFRLPALSIHVVNTFLLLLIALPVADFFVRPSHQLDAQSAAAARHYSYEQTGSDPKSLGRWWRLFLEEWYDLFSEIARPDSSGTAPFVLKPGSEGSFFDSRIFINHLGFRGPEFASEKGNAYRIVALGESTTFGMTLSDSEETWPQLLQQMIAQRMDLGRPVQVINAGIPSHTLRDNLRRMKSDILPLNPDMIISYHGYNGFPWLDNSLPAVAEQGLPHYRQRPLKLLADCEYRFKVMRYKRKRDSNQQPAPRAPAGLLQTEYASAYRQLIQLTHTNGIRLALANYSMAVNSNSPLDVVEFYRAGFPEVYSQIRANSLHSRILNRLCEEHPEVLLIDTQPLLDGEHERFIDLVHLTQHGRRRLAETMFENIQEMLERDLNDGKSPAQSRTASRLSPE